MAEGLNVDVGAFSSPPWEIAGQEDAHHLAGIEDYDPSSQELMYMGALPSFGDLGMGDTAYAVSAVRESIPPAGPVTRHAIKHTASKAVNPRSAMPWVLAAFILYFAVLSVQVNARAGVKV